MLMKAWPMETKTEIRLRKSSIKKSAFKLTTRMVVVIKYQWRKRGQS